MHEYCVSSQLFGSTAWVDVMCYASFSQAPSPLTFEHHDMYELHTPKLISTRYQSK